MKLQPDPIHRLDEIVVHEQFQAGSDVQGPLGAGLLCQGILGCHG